MKTIKNMVWFFLVMIMTVLPADGGVYLDPTRDAIVVVDYPASLPCTPAHLAAMDRACGWGRVEYDLASQRCVLTGNLIIGANDGSETVFQVGAPDRPHETLIMHGNLYIHPYFIQGENGTVYWKTPKRMNAVILGDKADKSINAALLFACTPSNRWTLFVGKLPWQDSKLTQWGGGIYVYNSRIEPLNSAPGHEIGDNVRGVYMGSTVLENARIAGVKGMLYGMSIAVHTPELKDYSIRDTVFENVEIPLANGTHKLSGCQFINCGTAVMDRGGLDAELTNCRFQSNNVNWSLTYSNKGLVLVDCTWDQPRQTDRYGVMRTNKTGKVQCPKLSVRRHVVVEVKDAEGKPVAGAKISITPEQEGSESLQIQKHKTDAQGRTPGPGESGAILLTDYVKTATEQRDQPTLAEFSYTITVARDGRQTRMVKVRPDKSWKIIEVNEK